MHAPPVLVIELDWQAYPRMPKLANGVLMGGVHGAQWLIDLVRTAELRRGEALERRFQVALRFPATRVTTIAVTAERLTREILLVIGVAATLWICAQAGRELRRN